MHWLSKELEMLIVSFHCSSCSTPELFSLLLAHAMGVISLDISFIVSLFSSCSQNKVHPTSIYNYIRTNAGAKN